ncbi:MAG TPA: ROK family protein [Bryobacterales bacterium]|nr:ROK family protein [Bryobacterales bacterium]
MPDYAIAIDLGGTNLRVAAFRPSGDLLDKVSVPTNISLGREHLMEAIVSGIQQVRKKHARDKLRGIGIGVPGFILLEKGIITKSPNLPGLENFPMRDDLEQRLGCPVVLENDANAAALGEKWKGAGRAVDDLVLLTLGTGIGGGIISGGKILHGYLGMAGELGHIVVDPPSTVRCGCGNYGCLEVNASATAIVRMAHEAILANRSPALTARQSGEITSALVYDLALAGDAECRAIFEHMGRALGLGLGILINTFNFPLYLLSGGVLAAWDLFAPAMLDEARKRSLTLRETTTRIERAELGDLAGLYGAACLALEAQPRR